MVEEIIAEIKSVLLKTHRKVRSGQEDYMQDRYAEALYKEGYRKQSKGVWVPSDVLPDDGDGVWIRYTCSRCKCFTEAYYRDVRDTSKFCPDCGAKMKNGA